MSQSWKRFIGFAIEDTWATAKASEQWFRFAGDDSLKTQANIIELDGTEESRSQLAYADGDWTCEGDLSDVELLPGLVVPLFQWAMGTLDDSADPVFVMTLVDGQQPSATIELQRGTAQAFQYLGMKINTMTMSAAARETVKLSFSLVGEREVALPSPTARTYLDETPFVFWQGVFKYKKSGGSLIEYRIQEFTLELDNNLRHPFMVSGARYSIEQTEGVRNVTGSFKTLFDTAARELYDDAINFREGEMEYTFTHVDGHELKLEMPRVMLESPEFDRGEQDYDSSFPFRAFKSGANKEFKVTYTEA